MSPVEKTALRILSVAESLFAEHGFNGVSLRQITAKAGVNLSAVNYHHYDKESLCRKILVLRLRQINEARLSALRGAEARVLDSIVPLDEIIEILARPLFLSGNDPVAYNGASRRLLGRIFTEPLPFTAEILTAEQQPAMMRFGQAIRRHTPSLTPQDFLWRLSFVVGAMHHAMATMHDMKSLTNGFCRNDDAEVALGNFTEFAIRALGRSA